MRRKPYYKKSHKAWYMEIGRKQVRLGADEEEAFKEYHRLMAQHEIAPSGSVLVHGELEFRGLELAN
jgi:hypothetical protein